MSLINNDNSNFIAPKIASKEGVRCDGQSGGNPYGVTMKSLAASDSAGLGINRPLVDKHYSNCNKQTGGAHNYDSDFGGAISYGYTKAGAALASDLKGSYFPVTRNPSINQCGAGRKRRRRKSRRKNKSRKSRRHRGGKRRTRRRLRKKSRKRKSRKRRRTRRRRRRQRGGSQGYSGPNTSGSMPWATGPGGFVKYNNCGK
jgi:hypothetical protein